MTFGQINPRLGTPKPVYVKILLDSGASGTLITAKWAKKLRQTKAKSVQWNTTAGTFVTSSRTKLQFKLPEFHEKRVVEYQVHVTKDLGRYDMIIGRDILEELGIDIKFSNNTMEWDDKVVPMKSIDAEVEDSFHAEDSEAMQDATDRIKQILDAKYEPADLDEVVASCKHLDANKQKALRQLLDKHKTLFDGTLGQWKGETYDVELKAGAEPYHARPFPIPRVHENTLRMEVDRLCKTGVLKKVNRSEWAAPTFIIPKKDGTVRFISDF